MKYMKNTCREIDIMAYTQAIEYFFEVETWLSNAFDLLKCIVLATRGARFLIHTFLKQSAKDGQKSNANSRVMVNDD